MLLFWLGFRGCLLSFTMIFFYKRLIDLREVFESGHLTSIHFHRKFARICVELDLDKPLVPYIYVRGYKLNLKYEVLHSMFSLKKLWLQGSV